MKTALFAFNGESMCFVHVLLNALDMKEKGYEVKVVIEGAAVKLLPELAGNPLYVKAREQGLIEGFCKACAAKMKTLDAGKAEGLAELGDMSGHPSMARYMNEGYRVITF
jgi:hypothetical protein